MTKKKALKTEKPEIFYYDPVFIEVGSPAIICVVDHPLINFPDDNHLIRTSIVQKYDKITGIFETRNSIYKPNCING